MNQKRALLVHAHPDDETINNGATMAKMVSEGVAVTLVTCTRGEEGEVLVPELAHLASSAEDKLGEHRVTELANAMKELGVTDHRFLGNYRDSGMMGTPQNDHPDCFWKADVEKAAKKLAEIIDEVKPQVLITYDEFGGYGHPDHIQAHRVAMRASEISSWDIQKIYWNIMPKSVVAKGIEAMKAQGSDFFGAENVDDLPFVKDDSFVSALVHAPEQVDKKMAAMKAHATQITVDGPFFALSNNLGVQVFGDEYYTLVKGTKSAPFNEDNFETDLFSGVKL
ncbi:MAG: N-acetyl-1-D-myo-inositol-2-amino-2-deoxy-alpha-D-glucopyranoside deacetylase [Actinomycetales bacterium]|jgi:N-acetyl-1-D-myo-inositol-2-amino-2-deoxy-alpha-D-glucopyranoside deacetylase|nr:N-acetyl-1-D-myo-inositol-2-amino-2-deoxy-alpha-D-glucopyranoside deacetylase [Actinomycetales bacterium]